MRIGAPGLRGSPVDAAHSAKGAGAALFVAALLLGGCGWNWAVGGAARDGGGLPSDATDDAAPDACRSRFVEVPIAETGDDGQISGPTPDLFPDGLPPPGKAQGLWAGIWSNGGAWVFLRFVLPVSLSGLVGARSVRLSLFGVGHAGGAYAEDELRYLNVLLHDSPDAPQIVDRFILFNGGVSTVPVDLRWSFASPEDWVTGDRNLSPDLTAMFAALHDSQGDLPAGAHVQLWLTNLDLMPPNNELVFGFSSSAQPSSRVEKLVIELADCD